MDIQEVQEGLLSTESTDDKFIVSILKNNSLNLVALPNEYLHML